MTSEPLNQYTEICRDAIKSSSAKLSKTFESLLLSTEQKKFVCDHTPEITCMDQAKVVNSAVAMMAAL
mgnify:CR=1 FL=1